MNAIQRLRFLLADRFPSGRFTLDPPPPSRKATDVWWLDIDVEGYRATVDWRSDRGFGLTGGRSITFGEGADEVFGDISTALERIATLAAAKRPTRSPQIRLLRDLRKSRRVSQVELANRLNLKQAAISRMERRADMHLSTLEERVKALGGVLEIRARFPNEVVVLDRGSVTRTTARRTKRRSVRK